MNKKINTVKKLKPKIIDNNYYILIEVNGEKINSKGIDYKVFSNLNISKITTKAIVTITKADKTFTTMFIPKILKKLISSEFVQILQFKRLSAKVN